MNLLVEDLPEAVEIDGIETPINSDFRSCLRVILAFEDNELTGLEKQMLLLANLYPERPGNIEKAIEQAIKFLNGGREDGDDGTHKPRVYSFSKDADLIFAAFYQTHGIDHQTTELHWWKFQALFMDLGADTAFCQLVNLRKRVKTGRATKEERRAAREMGAIFDVPELDTRTPDEREAEARFLELVGKEAK
jgi:hypothetical protein